MGCMNLPRRALVTVLPIPLRLKLIDFAQQPQLQPPGWNPSMLILLPRVFTQPRPKAVINQIKIAQCSGLLLHRAWLGSERHAGAAARRPGGNVLVADAADQTDCLVGALPSKITVQAGDTRRRLVAPPGIL